MCSVFAWNEVDVQRVRWKIGLWELWTQMPSTTLRYPTSPSAEPSVATLNDWSVFAHLAVSVAVTYWLLFAIPPYAGERNSACPRTICSVVAQTQNPNTRRWGTMRQRRWDNSPEEEQRQRTISTYQATGNSHRGLMTSLWDLWIT